MSLQGKSLKFKILFSVIVGIFILAGLIISISGKMNHDLAFEKAVAVAESNARESNREIEKILNENMKTMKNLAHTMEAVVSKDNNMTMSRHSTIDLLKKIITEHEYLVGSYVGFEANQYIDDDNLWIGKKGNQETGRFTPYWNKASDGKLAFSSLSDFSGEWYQKPKATLKEVVSEPAVYPIQGVDVLMTSLTVPIINEGQFVGLAGGDIALNDLQKLTDKIDLYNGQGKMLILSAKGIIAGKTKEKEFVGKDIKKTSPIYKEIFEALSKKRHETFIHETDKYLRVFQPINLGPNNHPWYTEIEIPKSIIKKEIIATTMNLVAIGVILAIAITIIIWLIINKSYVKLIVVEKQLGDSVQVTNRNSIKLQQSSESVASSATEQASSIQETVSTLDEINAMAQKSALGAKSSSDKADENLKITNEGKESIEEMIHVIEDIRLSNDQVVKQIENSNNEFQRIITIINEISQKAQVINDIVSQTKLLSFNASVEAARAGEQGKGFAVVAEEVGNLAQSSGDAATEIGSMLAESVETVQRIIRETTDQVNSLIQEGQKKIDRGVNVANRCGSTLDVILGNVGEMTGVMREISEASDEQATGVNAITDAMNLIDTSIHENSTVAENTAKLSTELTAQAKNLEKALNDLKRELYGR